MRIIKRSGEEVAFNREKIEAAVKKANQSVCEADRLPEARIKLLASIVEGRCEELGHIPNVEEVQDMVIKELMKTTSYNLAQNYIIYRFQHNQMRGNTTDAEVLSIVNGTNEELRTENANKDVSIASTQRDYMAGQTSRDVSRRLLLPEEIVRSTSMTWTFSPSEFTTAVWLRWTICFRMAPSSQTQWLRSPIVSLLPATLQLKLLLRWRPTSTAARLSP